MGIGMKRGGRGVPRRRVASKGWLLPLLTGLVCWTGPEGLAVDPPGGGSAPLQVETSVTPRWLEDGDRVTLIGDSITWSRKWHRYIHEYYVTRFPDRRIAFFNAGISGDGSAGAVSRLQRDILVPRPTVAVFLLGMNDVGRGLYDITQQESPERLASRERSLAGFRAHMSTLSERLIENGTRRLIFCSPTPYDEAAITRNTNRLVGVNDALGRCGEILRELSATYGGEFIDIHGPMTELNVRLQQEDPAASIVGWDRIHPGLSGQMAMAYLFLTSQGVPALVSAITIDAASSSVLESRNATVSEVTKKDPDGLAFTVLEGALPWPIEEDALKAMPDLPFERDLNQQTLRVTGLASGAYRLTIDAAEIGLFDAAELAQGLNLAMRPETPQFQQARAVQNLLEERRESEIRLRRLASNERWLLRDIGVDLDDFEAVKARVGELLAVPPPDGADEAELGRRERMQAYVENKPRSGEFRAELAAILDRAYETAQPKPRRYGLERMERL